MLDEMFSPAIAAALRELGHDVVAVAERVDLRSMTDDGLFAWSLGSGDFSGGVHGAAGVLRALGFEIRNTRGPLP